jgi:hypothetical protein
MDTMQLQASQDPAAVYDRVVGDARQSFGHLVSDEVVVTAAREAVDELLVQGNPRVTAFIPVLAMRRLRETIAGAISPE